MTEEIINLTPHAIKVMVDDGGEGLTITVPPSGTVARCTTAEKAGPDVAGVPTFVVGFGAVTGLPDERTGVALIVSQLVAHALPARRDLFFPHRLVRDATGQIVGAEALGQVPLR